MKRHLICGLVVALGCIPSGHAQLVFEQAEVFVKASVTDTKVSGTFRFTNESDYPVLLKDVKTSCGCTTTDLEKRPYAPGEKGEFEAVLDIGSRVGMQRKSITVTTDDPKQPQIRLMLRVEIPQVLSFNTRFLAWRQGEDLRTKTVHVTRGEGLDVSIEEVSLLPDNDRFEVVLDRGDGNGPMEVRVTPKDLAEGGRTMMRLRTNFPEDKPKDYYVTLFVQRMRGEVQPQSRNPAMERSH